VQRTVFLALASLVLMAAGCSSVRPTPNATRTATIPPTSRAIDLTDGAITGRVLPCPGLPRSGVPTVVVDLFPPSGIQIGVDPETETAVEPGSTYHLNAVPPGNYALIDGWVVPDEVVDEHVTVTRSRTLVANLPSCFPTVGGPYRAASLSAVARFVAEARRGTDATLSAMYESLLPGRLPRSFLVAQRQSKGAAIVGTDTFLYSARESGKWFRFLELAHGIYECAQNSDSRWGCEGPVPYFSNGVALTTLYFDEPVLLAQDVGPRPGEQGALWSGRLDGRRVTCLRDGEYGGRTTSCIASDGLVVFAAGPGLPSVAVVQLTFSVPASDFVLPVRSGRWTGFMSEGS